MSNNKHESKLAGRLFLCLIGASLLVIGGVFGWLMLRSYENAKASREWPQVEAVVLSSTMNERQISGSPKEYSVGVLYSYSYDGVSYTSDRIVPRGVKWTKDPRTLEANRDLFKKGSVHQAWVRPDSQNVKNADSSEKANAPHDYAILLHDTKAAGYTVWFPGVIMLGGAGMIFGAFIKK